MGIYVDLHTLERSIYVAVCGCTVGMSARTSAAPVALPRAVKKKMFRGCASACAVARHVAPWSADII